MIESVVGAIGLFFLLLAFSINHFKVYRRFSYTYNGLNFAGALLLTYYAFAIDSLVFMILEGVWVLIALYFLVKKVKAYD